MLLPVPQGMRLGHSKSCLCSYSEPHFCGTLRAWRSLVQAVAPGWAVGAGRAGPILAGKASETCSGAGILVLQCLSWVILYLSWTVLSIPERKPFFPGQSVALCSVGHQCIPLRSGRMGAGKEALPSPFPAATCNVAMRSVMLTAWQPAPPVMTL